MLLDNLTEAAQDPILSLSVACQQDPRPEKLDLGIGVYRDSLGRTPVMAAVHEAEARLLATQETKSYVGLAGNAAFNETILELLFDDSDLRQRARALQTPGASGALRMLADVVQLASPGTTVWMSDPSYANHAPIMQAAGLKVRYFPYFDRHTKLVNPEAMLATLQAAGRQDVVLLHGCCHNPTGADLDLDTWKAVAALAQQNGFLPFVDIAYQGFGDGLEEDAAGMRYLAEKVEAMLVTTSCSKNFGLYRERVGAAVVIGTSARQAELVKGRLMGAARANYTMPPDHGAAVVAMILADPALKATWMDELTQMRSRVIRLRTLLAQSLREQSGSDRYDFIEQHKGMFSVIGTTPEQAQRLRKEFAIYMVDSGRVNVAGLSESQISRFSECLLKVTAD